MPNPALHLTKAIIRREELCVGESWWTAFQQQQPAALFTSSLASRVKGIWFWMIVLVLSICQSSCKSTCSVICSRIRAGQHVQFLVSASPFNIMVRWMTGIYRQRCQTRRFILQKPSSCEKNHEEPCNTHAGQHLKSTTGITVTFHWLFWEMKCVDCGCVHAVFGQSNCHDPCAQVLQHVRMSQSSSPHLSFAF